jgi:hypothetical protein
MSENEFDDSVITRLKHASAVAEREKSAAAQLGALFQHFGLNVPACGDRPEGSPVDEDLYQRHRQAFAKIVQCLSDQYSHGQLAVLDDRKLGELVRETHDLIDRWDEDEPVEGWTCETELQKLLQAHHDLGTEIVVDEDDEMGDEENEDEDEGDDSNLTEEEKATVDDLTRQLSAKFDEIVGELAKARGIDDISALSAEQMATLRSEAEDECDRWSEREIEDAPPEPKTRLERLLREHYEVGELIMSIEDEAESRSLGLDDEE